MQPPALGVLALHGPLKKLDVEDYNDGFDVNDIALFLTTCQDKCERGAIHVRVSYSDQRRCVEWCGVWRVVWCSVWVVWWVV